MHSQGRNPIWVDDIGGIQPIEFQEIAARLGGLSVQSRGAAIVDLPVSDEVSFALVLDQLRINTRALGNYPMYRIWLSEWRRAKMLTQRELAQQAGISRTTIELLERPNTDQRARISTIRKLAEALGITPTELLGPPPETQVGPGHEKGSTETPGGQAVLERS